MTNLLIYRDRASFFNDDKTVLKLRESFVGSEFCSRDLSQLREKILKGKVQALLILVQNGISTELEEFLAKNKNHINLHDSLLMVAHGKLSGPEAQRSLMLGASYVFKSPLNVDYLSKLLASYFRNEELGTKPSFENFLSPLSCRLDTFGRIDWLEKQAPFDVCVETSLDLKIGDQIDLHHLLAFDLGEEKLSYEVLERTTRGLYYRYA